MKKKNLLVKKKKTKKFFKKNKILSNNFPNFLIFPAYGPNRPRTFLLFGPALKNCVRPAAQH